MKAGERDGQGIETGADAEGSVSATRSEEEVALIVGMIDGMISSAGSPGIPVDDSALASAIRAVTDP